MLTTILTYPVSTLVFLECVGAAAALGCLCALIFSIRNGISQGFALSMVLLPAAVCVVIMMVNGNIGAGLVVGGTFAMVRFRSIQGTAKEIVELFIGVVIGVACGMGYLGAAAILTAVCCIVVPLLTLTEFCAVPSSCRTMKVTLPEHLDYNTALNDVFERYHVKAKLLGVRTNNMGTLFEVTYQLVLPGTTIPKEFMDEIRVRNSNLAVIISSYGERDRL